jgi:hypothetical protein
MSESVNNTFFLVIEGPTRGALGEKCALRIGLPD